MTEKKKELTAIHGALFALVFFGFIIGVGAASGMFKRDQEEILKSIRETKRVEQLPAGVVIGKAGAEQRYVVERFYDVDAGNFCYVLEEYRGLSCVPATSEAIARMHKEKLQ